MPMVSLKLMAGAARSMVVASARTTAAEIAARWCARKVRGEDRERPYTGSNHGWVVGARACLPSARSARSKVGESAPVVSVTTRRVTGCVPGSPRCLFTGRTFLFRSERFWNYRANNNNNDDLAPHSVSVAPEWVCHRLQVLPRRQYCTRATARSAFASLKAMRTV